jgi:hypoxanthine phosphoribosyltransferase
MKIDDKLYFSKNDINAMIEKLANKIIKSKKHIDIVVGIESSGLYISKPLAQLLNKPHASIKVSFYGENKTPSKTPIVNDRGMKWNETDSYLFVDDLIDSGSTIKYLPNITKSAKNFQTAVLFWKKDNEHKVKPTYWVEEKPEGWLTFYWE